MKPDWSVAIVRTPFTKAIRRAFCAVRTRTFFQEIRYLLITERPHLFFFARVAEKREYVVG